MTDTPSMTYHVTAEIQDSSHALITAREHRLILNVKKGSGEEACGQGSNLSATPVAQV